MKKKVLLFAAACVVMGMFLTGVGLILGGKGFSIGWSGSGLSFGNDDQYYTLCDMDVEEFSRITVKVHNCPVTVRPSDNGKYGVDIRLAVSSEEDIPVHIADGELVVENTAKKGWLFWNFDFLSGEEEYVILYLPEKEYQELHLSTSNANITVEGIDTGDDLLYVHSSNGSLRLEEVHAGEIDAKTSNSSIVLEGVYADIVKAVSSNGRIEFTDVEAQELRADTSNSAVRFEGVYGMKAEVESSNGSIKLDRVHFDELLDVKTSNSSIEVELDGSKEEYSIDASTSNSEVRVEGEDYGKKYRGGDGGAKVILRSSNDKITVNFQ